MDWNFLVGIGTVAMAIATFLYVNQSRTQTKVILRQLNLQAGQQIPRLFIKQVSFEPNSIKIDIQNATTVPATCLGLETMFFIIGQRLYADQTSENEISWGEAIKLRDEGKTVYAKYYWLGPVREHKLRFENQEVDANAVISFFSPQGVSVYFPPNSTIQVETTPKFIISWKNNDGLKSYHGFEYNDFRNFLLSNNVKAVAVTMDLLCKDSGEMVHHQGNVASFVIRTDLDKSLLESSKNAQRFDFIALSHVEQLSEKSWIPYEYYHNTYSNWHVF